MIASISRPELLTITDETSNKTFFGGCQDWYCDEWHRRAGCGPTCASNVLAYLALSRPALRPLYARGGMSLSDFTRHMEDVYQYVTPGNMGINRLEMFTDGITAFARSRGVSLRPRLFGVCGNMSRNRPSAQALADYIAEGLSSDCPVGFLNLTKGRVKNLQSWHWVTIVSSDDDGGRLYTTASDEGREVRFDLRLWYLTTRLHGGLAYFTA